MKEIYNFTQDDLTTEDVLVLDCHNELYVWIGCHSKVKSKQQALTFGLVNQRSILCFFFFFQKLKYLTMRTAMHSRVCAISTVREPP